MFKKRKHHQYLNDYIRPTPSMKVNNIIAQAIPDTPVAPRNSGISDTEGLARAYAAPNAIYRW